MMNSDFAGRKNQGLYYKHFFKKLGARQLAGRFQGPLLRGAPAPGPAEPEILGRVPDGHGLGHL